jgi:hypothetical protein
MNGRIPQWPSVVVVTVVLSGTSCRNSAERRLDGRWLGDRVENVDSGNLAPATGWTKGTSMEFAGSSVTVAIPAEEPRTGKYQVVKDTDPSIELRVSRPGGGSDSVQLEVADEDTLRWVIGGGRVVVLRREE